MKSYNIYLKILLFSLLMPMHCRSMQSLKNIKEYLIKTELIKYLIQHKKLTLSVVLPLASLFLFAHVPISLKNPIYSLKPSCDTYTPKETENSFYYIHGWSEKKYVNQLGETMQNATVFVPHFSENITNRRFLTAFGQELDVISILECLKENYEKDEVINVVARSRGAQAFLNTLYVLCSKKHPLLENTGIDENIQTIILEKMRTGVVILVVPLIDISTTFKYHFGPIVGKIMTQYIFPFVSRKRYKYQGMHALQLLQEEPDFKPYLNISIIFAKNDWVTGARKKEQKELIEAINSFNGEDVKAFDVEGGHRSAQQKEKMQELIREKIIKK